jgi:lipopolysaccharide/colanic/teichoic acid biosynthesis glycosyltransferase
MKRVGDLLVATALLVVLSPIILVVAVAIKLDSEGPVFYRSRRVGQHGREFGMLKFRKMHRDASGPPLTAANDERLTRIGVFLTRSKLDELPQLVNVVRGEMSLVGPRPEDPTFVRLHPGKWGEVLRVKPGITGLSQLAFARESSILERPEFDGRYVDRILPAKLQTDGLYIARHSILLDAQILCWTAVVVLFGIDVAVDRGTGRLSVRRRPAVAPAASGQEAA